jgi:signal transduction histidine kinase
MHYGISMVTWIRHLLERMVSNSPVSTSRRSELLDARNAAKQASDAARVQAALASALKEARDKPKIDSAIKALNRRARAVRDTIGGDIQDTIAKGETRLYIRDLLVRGAYYYSDNDEIERLLKRVILHASDLQSLVGDLRDRGYDATPFVHEQHRNNRDGSLFSVWLGVHFETK